MASDDQAARAVEYLCPRHTYLNSVLVRVGDGDRDAFAALYDEFSQTVYAMSLHVGHEPQVAAQITHDVFLRAWRQARTYEPTAESAWTWFRTIALEVINNSTGERAKATAARSRTPDEAAARERIGGARTVM